MRNAVDILNDPKFFRRGRLQVLEGWQEEIQEEYAKKLRGAIGDYLDEHGDPKTEYGPHGEGVDWYHEEDVSEAVEKAEVEILADDTEITEKVDEG